MRAPGFLAPGTHNLPWTRLMAPDSHGDAADATETAEAGRDYRPTVFLPDTPFPMRGGLPQKEPEILARWAEQDLYFAMRKARQDAGAPLFVLHDGPPYANGGSTSATRCRRPPRIS